MKFAFFLPFILLLGLIIGSWAPKEELRAAKRELDDLKKSQSVREKDSRMDAFTRMVQIPDRAKATKKQPKPGATNAPANPVPASGNQAAASLLLTATNAVSSTPPQPLPPPKPEDLRARIDEAKELWKARVDIARAQWIERLKLTPEAATLFDDAINTMNEDLYAAMQGFADRLAAGEELTPEIGTRAFNEMTTALVQSYDALGAFVPEAQRGVAAQIELADFIDPGVAEPLIAVQDKLEKMPPSERRRGPRFLR